MFIKVWEIVYEKGFILFPVFAGHDVYYKVQSYMSISDICKSHKVALKIICHTFC